MKTLKKILEVVYRKHTQEDWDTVYVICGDEGISKSNLALHITDWWYTKKEGECRAEHIKHIGLDRDQFKKDLASLKQYELTCYDEAGDLSNRRFMDKFNYEITQAYMVIRGDNLFTILVLPSFFDLDPFFSKRRVRGLIYVYKRGRFAFWSKNRLRQLAMVNQGFPVKNYWIVKPTYSLGYFGKYKGVLKEPYDKLKKEKMEKARQNLVKTEEDDKKAVRNKIIFKMREEGDTMKKIGKCLGITTQAVSYIIKQSKLKEQKEI